MGFKTPKNENYCATVVEIKNIIPMFTTKGEPCTSIQATSIFGNTVVIGKDTNIGDIGLFFPVETQLSQEFLFENSLYRDMDLNKDQTHKGLFETNGRIKCQKLQGTPSMGFFCPIDYLTYAMGKPHRESLVIGDTFDYWVDFQICQKYIPKSSRTPGQGNAKNMGRVKRTSKLIDGQFRQHYDTMQIGRSMHLFQPNSLISATEKWHGTSVVISKILTKRKINMWQKFLKLLGANIIESQYDSVYSTRKVIQNAFADGDKQFNMFYGGTPKENIYKSANDMIYPFLSDGMTVYAEIVGFIPTGAYIQKPYDYGCNQEKKEFKVYIYRVTYTNPSGIVFEFSAKQVQNWCKSNGLNPVVEIFYGRLRDFVPEVDYTKEDWRDEFLVKAREKYLEKDCPYCSTKIPAEGIVIRDEDSNVAYKFKSFRFLKHETEMLDKNEPDMEEQTGDDDVE